LALYSRLALLAETMTTRTQAMMVGTAAAHRISGVAELEDGELLIGSDIAYPPIESFEEGTDKPVGLDIDIAQALAAELGVDVKFEQVADFAGIVGDLKSKRYDIVMSPSVSPEREAEIALCPTRPVGTASRQKGNPAGLRL
jgi:polar amino acid transport system substrate-binding protein